MNGLVIKSTGSWYLVKIDDGSIFNCRLKGKFRIQDIKSTNPIVVGDNVKIEKVDNSFMITELYERKNFIVRKSVNLSKQTHIIAANIDQAILMITLESPVTTTSFIDRFLVAANAYNVEVVLLFNKIDMYNDELLTHHAYVEDTYKDIGYITFSTSVLNNDLSLLMDLMRGKLNMIAGHSGVGKSTLINKLQPDLEIETKEISESSNQGQHTTTFCELYDLDFGASIIDTPGIKGFGLVEIDKSELSSYFPEFHKLRKGCKFHNCIHLNEPSCEVKSAIEDNRIAESRYLSYLGMLEHDDDKYRVNNY